MMKATMLPAANEGFQLVFCIFAIVLIRLGAAFKPRGALYVHEIDSSCFRRPSWRSWRCSPQWTTARATRLV